MVFVRPSVSQNLDLGNPQTQNFRNSLTLNFSLHFDIKNEKNFQEFLKKGGSNSYQITEMGAQDNIFQLKYNNFRFI